MHRASNHLTARQDRLRWLVDIHLLAARLTPLQWQELVARARQARLADASMDGLLSAGRVFDTEIPDPCLDTLAAAARDEPIRSQRLAHWAYYQWCGWQAQPNLRMRLRWLRQLLLPDAEHLAQRYGQPGAVFPVLLLRRALDGAGRWWRYQ